MGDAVGEVAAGSEMPDGPRSFSSFFERSRWSMESAKDDFVRL